MVHTELDLYDSGLAQTVGCSEQGYSSCQWGWPMESCEMVEVVKRAYE